MDTNTNYSTQSVQPAEQTMTIGDWMLTTFLLMIPCVGIILLFVWAFCDTKNTKPSKSNYAKAMLIWYAISIVISIVFSSALMAVVTSFVSQLQ